MEIEVQDPQIPQEIKYEDLQNDFQNNDCEQIINQLQVQLQQIEQDWRLQYNFILNLRIFHKYYPQNLRHCLDNFSQIIQQSLLHLRSQIQKVANIFVQELFIYNQVDHKITQHFLLAVLPTIFLCSVSNKQFIKQEALILIQNLENFPLNDLILKILTDLCDHKNLKIGESSSQVLLNIIYNQQNQISINQDRIILIINLILKLSIGKRPIFEKIAYKINQILIYQYGIENFQNAIAQLLTIEQQKKIINLGNQVQKQQTRENLQDIKKQLKEKLQ